MFSFSVYIVVVAAAAAACIALCCFKLKIKIYIDMITYHLNKLTVIKTNYTVVIKAEYKSQIIFF